MPAHDQLHRNTPALLQTTWQHAAAWFASLADRPVCAAASADELRQALGGPLPQEGLAPEIVTGILADAAQ